MNVTDRRAARAAARVLVAPVALALLAVAAPQAAAHTELDTSSPAESATLAGLPPRVTLTFSDAMAQKYAKVAVTGPDGKSAATGDPAVEGKTVTLPLDAASPAGRYTVGYRVVSADGHPVSGSYTFTVKETNSVNPSPRTADAPSPSAARQAESDEAGGESSGTRITAVVGGGVLVLIVAGVGAYVARRRRAGRGH
ncbi:copper resistance protein CopC [Streptomyces cellulosae]|uniref:copper resistance CopC family protein n=1 Tax=Streptomyces TaxID=1883 RepID=UPI00225359A1|nr:copper resistance CopC family protein [Streptomyces sp. OS603R]MCX4481585.1 copper resistance protein CopC [Streptomyces cellulosae]WTC54941.1 copper resistance protein CopC [Streptomyces cellulosae]